MLNLFFTTTFLALPRALVSIFPSSRGVERIEHFSYALKVSASAGRGSHSHTEK
jgi:hypothetical protein